MNWFVYALLAALFSAISRNITRLSMKDGGDEKAFTIIHNLAAVIIVIPLIISSSWWLPKIGKVWILFVAAMIFYTVADWAVVKALKTVEASVHLVLIRLRTIWVLLGGWLIYQELFSVGKIIGSILIILGTILAVVNKKKFTLPKGAFFTFLASVCLSAGFLTDKTLVQFFPVPVYTFLSLLIPSILIGATMKNQVISRLQLEWQKKKLAVLLAGGLFGLYFLFQSYAFKVGEVSKGAVVIESSVITGALLAFFLLNERENMLLKILGAILVFLGVMAVKLY